MVSLIDIGVFLFYFGFARCLLCTLTSLSVVTLLTLIVCLSLFAICSPTLILIYRFSHAFQFVRTQIMLAGERCSIAGKAGS